MPNDNPYDLAPYLTEAFSEILAEMDGHQQADLVEHMLRGRTMVWADSLETRLVSYMQEQVHNARYGYLEVEA